MPKCSDIRTASTESTLTASRYHRQERDDFAKENIMFDIFCCLFSLSLPGFVAFTVVVVMAAIKPMVDTCARLFIGFYMHSRATKTSRTGNGGLAKKKQSSEKRKIKEDATFLSMFLCDFAVYGHLLYYYIVSIIVYDEIGA